MKTLAAVVSILLIAGCAVPITQSNTTIVMAKNVERGKGASGIADVFDLQGQIYAYMTFRWEPLTANGGHQTIEARWFNGQREVMRREHQATFGNPPWHVWMPATGPALGVGDCRVEVYIRGRLVGQKAFRVVEKL